MSQPTQLRLRLPQPRRDQIPWRLVASVASVLSLFALFYFYFQSRHETDERARIIKQRQALALEVRDDYASLKNRVEQWTVSAASGAYPGDSVDADARKFAWREQPAVYLRTRVADAISLDVLHAQARTVALDGLAGCLLRVKGDVGPWSIGEVIAHSEALGADFVKDVRETRNDLRLRQLAYALDEYKEKRFPILRDAVRRAEYAIIVIDEDPAKIPEQSAAFGKDATTLQRILGVRHPVRLHVRRLSDDKEILRIRRVPDAAPLQLAGAVVADPGALEVRQGQALGCAMANEALAAAGLGDTPSMVNAPAPLPLAAPSATASASASSASASAPATPASASAGGANKPG